VQWNPRDEYNEKGYYHVLGADEKTDADGTTWAIEFVPWNQWLGMEIDAPTLKKFASKKLDLLCHCLWEMTYCGYDEKKIQDQIKEMTEAASETIKKAKGKK
jgi:hypothetical protein